MRNIVFVNRWKQNTFLRVEFAPFILIWRSNIGNKYSIEWFGICIHIDRTNK